MEATSSPDRYSRLIIVPTTLSSSLFLSSGSVTSCVNEPTVQP